MSDRDHAPSRTRRRDFVRGLALGAPATLLTTPGSAPAQDPKPAEDQPKPETLPTEADARMALVLARHGKLLDDDARKAVRDEIESHVRRAEALRTFPLDNGDGPFPVFTPYRAPLA